MLTSGVSRTVACKGVKYSTWIPHVATSDMR